MRLYAALPCNSGPPMACCGGSDGGSAPAPCHCSLSPVAPFHAVVETAPPGVIVNDAPASSLVGPDRAALTPLAAPEPAARAAPLFVLFVAFLN